MNLQPLFPSPILDQQYLDRDYDGYGNDVWIVRMAEEHVVVRVSAREGVGGAYWTGLARLFGIDGTSMDDLRAANDAVNDVGVFRAPRVLRTGTIEGRAAAVTELMPGRHVDSFDALPPSQAESFGAALARGHQRSFAHCGGPTGRLAYPLTEFHARAADCIEWLAAEYRDDEPRDIELASEMASPLRALPPPETSALILYDIGGSQYLWDDAGATPVGATAVVDTECFVYAPRDLELVCLEADNGRAFCEAFRRGYEAVAPLPDLAPYRDAYRALDALTETNGDLAIEEALTAPVWF